MCVFQVPKGHVWLEGDNLRNSSDSRSYGPIPYALIRGRVCLKVTEEVYCVLSSFYFLKKFVILQNQESNFKPLVYGLWQCWAIYYLFIICISPICSFISIIQRHESVRSSKQVCLIDQSLDNILSSFPFCCVVMSLDVIAATTLETGQPTFCPSDWTAALHWRPYYDSWWNNKIFYGVKHIIKCHVSKCVQEER